MPEMPSRRDPPSEAATASTGGRVLLVEDHPDVRARLSLGAAEFLSKPIEIELLRQKAGALIQAPNRPSLQGAHDVPTVGRTEGAQPLRTERRAARRDAFWIG